jgi:hypothetical protein
MTNIVWTAAQTGLLVQAWTEGHASRDIGQMVGMSAAAVRCKRRRMGLPARSEASQDVIGHVCGVALVGHRVLARPDYDNRADPLPGSMPRPWLLRERGECAWPVRGFGDETLSCCLPVEPGRGYCPGHVAAMRREPWPPEDPGNVLLFRRPLAKSNERVERRR